ncbi:hypothetical protein M8A51_18465 [Schlegelella sp. S2-27]|uniref:Uncharacterized protein n=1 Tax=Caldimonas mangrovi TaxID=2944811 RepID=A0ABT0YRZ4_9BURK|nr:hypothetical protein [Caldimonas mangrovi]MCM5681515.1 hypothetical protein [Caldimonas mangrovi]
MNKPQHALQVMATLAARLQSAAPASLDTPFGVRLEPAHGIYAVDQRVSAPGLDACSPRVECKVAAVGLRSDHPGVWYLLRGVDPHGGHALVHESDLRAVTQAPATPLPEAQPRHALAIRTGASGRPTLGIPARFVRPTAFSSSGARAVRSR